MPCFNGDSIGDAYNVARDAERKAEKVEALLFGLVTALEKLGVLDSVMTSFDEKEAGQSVADFRAWWGRHKRDDERRREWEAARNAKAEGK
jgi:hypothetical protein